MLRHTPMILSFAAVLFASQARASDPRELNESEMKALSVKLVSEFKKCADLNGTLVHVDSFNNKTDESIDKTHFIGLVTSRLTKIKQTKFSAGDGVGLPAISITIESTKSEVNGTFHGRYTLMMTLIEHSETVCEGKASLKKNGKIKS